MTIEAAETGTTKRIKHGKTYIKVYSKHGHSFTAYDVMGSVGCALYTARYRLERWVSDPLKTVDWLMRPKEKIGLNGTPRGNEEFRRLAAA